MLTNVELDDIAGLLPSPLAWRVADLARPDAPLNASFYAAEAIFRFTALVVKASYLDQPRPILPMNVLIRRDLSFPSMGSWRSFVVAAIRNSREWGWDIGLPKLDALANACEKSEKLVQLRNAALGHVGGVPDSEAENEIRALISEPLAALVRAAAIAFREAELVVFDEVCQSWMTWRGPVGAGAVAHAFFGEVDVPACLLYPGRQALPLFPLVVRTFDGFSEDTPGAARNVVLLFDGVDFDRTRMIYVGRYGRGHGKRWFHAWRTRLERLRVPMVPVRREELSVDALKERLRQSLDVAVQEAGGSFEAIRLSPSAMGQLDDALASDATVAFLGGTAGAGKTAIACAISKRWEALGHPVLLLRASDLIVGTFEQAIRGSVESALAVVGEPKHVFQLLQPDRRAVLVIDGLDEVGVTHTALSLLQSLVRWTADLSVFLLVTCRTEVWRDLKRIDRELRVNAFARLSGRLYRPSSKGHSGSDEADDSIRVDPLPESDAMACWEHYRATVRGRQPTTAWKCLPPSVRRACANPRWMMRALERWDQREVPAIATWDLWKQWFEEETRIRSRLAAVNLLVSAQQMTGNAACRLDDVFRGREDQTESTGWHLVAAGLWRMRIDSSDPDRGPLVEFASPEIAAHAWARRPPLSDAIGAATHALATHLDDRPARHILTEAIVARLHERPHDVSGWEWVNDGEIAEAILRVEAVDRHDLLDLRPPEERSAVLVTCGERALDQGRAGEFFGHAEAILGEASQWLDGRAVWALARVLRHGDRKAVGPLLVAIVELGGPTTAWAALALAEHERETGRWLEAIRQYDLALSSTLPDDLAALALASRGECRIWRREHILALADLDAAATGLPPDCDPFLRCNLHIKRSIAFRCTGRPVRAAKELAAAAALATTEHLAIEQGKIALEKALVLGTVGVTQEAIDLARTALALHERQGFVKGRKKALFCLGWLHERAGSIEAAIEAYNASLQLNREYFDRLGLALNHEALARVDKSTARDEHRKKAQEYAKELGGLPHVDLL